MVTIWSALAQPSLLNPESPAPTSTRYGGRISALRTWLVIGTTITVEERAIAGVWTMTAGWVPAIT
jgi:hypothetical protein